MSGARTATRIGIDAVRVARLARTGRADERVARAVLGPGELRWALARPTSPVRLAAGIALKEAAIKCAGGRRPGFAWHDIRIAPVRPGRCPCGERAEALIRGLYVDRARAASVRAPGVSACCPAGLGAAAAWGCGDGLVVAVVIGRDPARPEDIDIEGSAAC
ncbi:4'-phosphopantetheinyl transferase superfamily protein [Embleya sp. NPDC020886]|uniref:4'-phosphopantetheinyl transferase superfamily protein n=1 Tax=Embleya sp. NPDC020886 TaxID=3363980 RepID=UPI0037A2DF68